MDTTTAIYNRLAGDAALVALLNSYNGEPAIFTTDPAPGDAVLPYIVTAGHVADTSWDTKVLRGREVWRDVRCYAAASGSALAVEAIAERVRALLHRHKLSVGGHHVVIAEASGPVVADEPPDAYGRIVTIRLAIGEN